MRQLITLAILVAVGLGVWKFWPNIKAMIVSQAEGDAKTEPQPDPPSPGPGTTTPGTTTPSSTTPGTSASGTTPSVPILPGPTTTTDTSRKVEGSVALELRAVPDEKGQTFDLEGATNLLPGTDLELAITARNAEVKKVMMRVVAGSPKNTFKTDNYQMPDGQYQVDVIMYVNRQTELELRTLYSQPQALQGPLVFNTPDGIIVRATGIFQKTKRKTPTEIKLKAGTAR